MQWIHSLVRLINRMRHDRDTITHTHRAERRKLKKKKNIFALLLCPMNIFHCGLFSYVLVMGSPFLFPSKRLFTCARKFRFRFYAFSAFYFLLFAVAPLCNISRFLHKQDNHKRNKPKNRPTMKSFLILSSQYRGVAKRIPPAKVQHTYLY